MAQLSTKIKLYAAANGVASVDFKSDVMLQDDGAGIYIKEWNLNGVSKPIDAQLDALSSQATTLEANNQVIQTRINLYGTTTEQLEYIVENGVDAFVTKQNQIKLDNPKGSE